MLRSGYKMDVAMQDGKEAGRCLNCGSKHRVTIFFNRRLWNSRSLERLDDDRTYTLCLACWDVFEEIPVYEP